jgi:hypothetical protein
MDRANRLLPCLANRQTAPEDEEGKAITLLLETNNGYLIDY